MKKAYLKKYIIIFSIAIVVMVADLVTKHFFGDTEKMNIIPHLINFETNHGNDGASFGIFGGKTTFLICLTVALIVLMLILDILFKRNSKLYNIAFSFILGGALGNLFDRIKFRYVRDFINFSFWEKFPTFNLADTFLCIGVGLMLVYLFFFCNNDKTKKSE